MRKEIANEWVAALPKYKKGMGFLHGGSGFCCLGVLCELAVKHGVIPPGVTDSVHGDIVVYSSDEHPGESDYTYLPKTVQKWAGMKSKQGVLAYPTQFRAGGGEYGQLSLANDALEESITFDDIARVIKERWEEL